MNSRRTWLGHNATGHFLRVQTEDGFVPKFGKHRSIPISKWLYDWLKAAADGHHLVARTMKERRAAAVRALKWLRQYGFRTQKPLHAVRGLCAAYLMATERDNVVTSMLGHDQISTTRRYYAAHPLDRKLIRLWKIPIPAPVQLEQTELTLGI